MIALYAENYLQTQNLSTYKLTNLQTNQLIKTPTENLKIITFILQIRSNFRSLLAKI